MLVAHQLWFSWMAYIMESLQYIEYYNESLTDHYSLKETSQFFPNPFNRRNLPLCVRLTLNLVSRQCTFKIVSIAHRREIYSNLWAIEFAFTQKVDYPYFTHEDRKTFSLIYTSFTL